MTNEITQLYQMTHDCDADILEEYNLMSWSYNLSAIFNKRCLQVTGFKIVLNVIAFSCIVDVDVYRAKFRSNVW